MIAWPQVANAGTTMLRYVVLICCDRLAGALHITYLNQEQIMAFLIFVFQDRKFGTHGDKNIKTTPFNRFKEKMKVELLRNY